MVANRNLIKTIDGEYPILFSAPHSVFHKRNDTIRPRENKTGTLAKFVAKKSKVHCIYKLKGEFNDANWDENCLYKEVCVNYIKENNIKFLIDLHGMAEYRKQDICIGINSGKNIFNRYDIVEKMITIFKQNGFENIEIDVPFPAGYKYCVSRYISEKAHIPCFQIELNYKIRSKKYKDFNMIGLTKALFEISEMLKKDLIN